MAKALKAAAVKLNPIQIITIVTIVTTFAANVVANVVGKTGSALVAGIVTSLEAALPAVEQITGKDLLNDQAFGEAMRAIAAAFVKAPKRKAK